MVGPTGTGGTTVPDAFQNAFGPGQLDPTSPVTTSGGTDSLTWSETSGNTITYFSGDSSGNVNYWVYRNGVLVGGGDASASAGSLQGINGAALAGLGIKLNFPDMGSTPIGGAVNIVPHTVQATPQAGGGGQGITPPRVPTAPPPGPNNPNGFGGVVNVQLDRSRYPETCAHIEDAINNGQPSVLTKDSDPVRNYLRRTAAVQGYPTLPSLDRDEYPMAMTLEGGAGADIRYISRGDNRGAGASIRSQLDPYPNGTQFTIECA